MNLFKYFVLFLAVTFIVLMTTTAFAATREEQKQAMTVLIELSMGKYKCGIDSIDSQAIEDVNEYTADLLGIKPEALAPIVVSTTNQIYDNASQEQRDQFCSVIKAKADRTFGTGI